MVGCLFFFIPTRNRCICQEFTKKYYNVVNKKGDALRDKGGVILLYQKFAQLFDTKMIGSKKMFLGTNWGPTTVELRQLGHEPKNKVVFKL